MEYKFHDKLVLRTPLNPLKVDFTVDELKALFSTDKGKDALFLASPDLSKEFDRWMNGELKNENKENKLIDSLLKYASRMHTRCTPFGLFAKCTIVDWGEENKIVLKDDNLFRSTRLDMSFSCQLAQELAKKDFVKPHLLFFPNTTIYKISDKIRYVDYGYKNKRRTYQISAVDSSVYVNKLLFKAKEGATIRELAEVLPKFDADITLEESTEFIEQLIEEQLLVSEIEPSVSGDELLNQILVVLDRIQKESNNAELKKNILFLEEIKEDIAKIDANIFNKVEDYIDLSKKLESLEIPFELSKLFQTDLFVNTDSSNTIDKSIQRNIKKAIRVFNRLSLKAQKTNLTNFQEKFQERYEEAEVPLLTVLDNEVGIGYAQNTNHTGDFSPLVNDLNVGGRAAGTNDMNWDNVEAFLLKKLLAAHKSGDKTITITEKEVEKFSEKWEDLPDSMSVMFKHLGDKIIMKHAGGASAVNLLGRFASSHSEINELVEKIAKEEKALNADKIIAEIVHLPEARTGNILMRPSFREYEIPYLSKSNLPLENQIGVDDLYLSIKNNKFVLRSKKLGKEILPRLGNAHNFSFRSLPAYHFLCDFQNYDTRGAIYFGWGSLQNEFNFLPRVEIENIIISKATWNLKKENFEKLLEKDCDLTTEIANWQKKWNLPDLILLAEGDNELLINLKSELSVKTLLNNIRKKPSIKIIEFLFEENNALVKNEEGKGFTNEFVLAISKTKKTVEVRPKEEEKKTEVQRNFTLGSEWLYYKIYCGSKTADEILTEVIKPLTENWKENNLIDKWFFIRYGDPHMHIRVRFHFTDKSNIGKVIQDFDAGIENYLETGMVWKIQADTYQRELERYGRNTMEMAEEIFYHDSHSIVSILDMIDRDGEGEKIRWLFALRAVDELLDCFQFDLETKKEVTESLRTGFGNEFGMNKYLNKQLDKKYRADKKAIEDILNRNTDNEGELVPLYQLIQTKTNQISPIISQFIELNKKGELEIDPRNLVGSYIHMLLNRLFKNKQRLHELVIYDFLWRKYKSDYSRQKFANKK